MNDKLYDLNFLNKISNSDNEFILEMVKSFIESSEEYMDKAERYLNDKNYDAFGKATHKYIPGVSFLGIKVIENDLMMLEDNCKKKVNLDNIGNRYNVIKEKIIELTQTFSKDFNLSTS